MIWQLAREQLRSQKRFIAWTGGMLVAVLTLATYSVVMSATEHQNNGDIYAITGADDAHHAYVMSYVDRSGDVAGDTEDGVAPLVTVDEAIAQAVKGGSDLQATRRLDVFVVDPSDSSSGLVAMTGDVDWDSLMVAGSPPAAGQVAISARIASQLGVEVGDSLDAIGDYVSVKYGGSADFEPEQIALTVSGITRSSVNHIDYSDTLPEAFASWDDSRTLAFVGDPNGTDSAGGAVVATDVSWSFGDPDLDVFSTTFDGQSLPVTSVSFATQVSAYLSWALAFGLVVMAIAIGRNQAEARIRWVGTARAMGARRSTIAGATALETLVIGLASSAVGIALGLLTATINQTSLRASVPYPFYPATPVVIPWQMLAMIGLGLVLSALIAVVPAFWAARIEPVDALRPEEAGIGSDQRRGVAANVLLYAWIASLVAIACLLVIPTFTGGNSPATTIVATVALVLTGAVSYRALLTIVRRVGARMGRSRSTWALVAGDALALRPRQAAIPALLYAIIIAPMSYLTVVTLGAPETADGEADGWVDLIWVIFTLMMVVALLIVTVVSLAVFFSGSKATRSDTATRTALGVTVAVERGARFARFTIAVGLGCLFGTVLGVTVAVILETWDGWGGTPDYVNSLLGLLLINAIAIALGALGGAIVAATTSRKPPVQEFASV